MRVLVFGRSGQVAQALAKAAPDAVCLGRDAADLTLPGTGARAIAEHAPDAVINAAAWTAVDAAEDAPDRTRRLNAEAPGELACACAGLGVPFVHISTDYVFDGTGTAPWQPDDPAHPLGVYGASKRAGEEAIVTSGAVFGILRSSWIFSHQGQNFLKTMLRLSETRSHLRIVADQIGGPTPADSVATACLRIAEALATAPQHAGIYHYAGAPDVSWASFAREIFRRAGRAVTVEEITTAEFPKPARRPLNSRLDCTTTETVFGLSRPDWRGGIDRALSALSART